MLRYFKTEEEFLEVYRDLYRVYKEEYYTPYTSADRAVSDFVSQGYKRFGWKGMNHIKKKMKAIAEQVDKEIGWVSPFQKTLK